MKCFFNKKFGAVFLVAAMVLIPVYAVSRSRSSKSSVKLRGDILTGSRVIRLMSGKSTSLKKSVASKLRNSYKLVDLNKDGYVTYEEYVTKGTYLTQSDRYNFFTSADRNWDYIMTEKEFVANAHIVAEGLKVFKGMDHNSDWNVTVKEFVRKKRSKIGSSKLASLVFKKFDTNTDNSISYTEFIVKWGYWSRHFVAL